MPLPSHQPQRCPRLFLVHQGLSSNVAESHGLTMYRLSLDELAILTLP